MDCDPVLIRLIVPLPGMKVPLLLRLPPMLSVDEFMRSFAAAFTVKLPNTVVAETAALKVTIAELLLLM